MPSIAGSLGGQIIFSSNEVPTPSGLPANYVNKINQLKIVSIKYGKGNKVRLHYAVYFKDPAASSRVVLAFVPVTATTPRPRLTTRTVAGRKAMWVRGSVEVNEKTMGEATYNVEAHIGSQLVGSGRIAFAK